MLQCVVYVYLTKTAVRRLVIRHVVDIHKEYELVLCTTILLISGFHFQENYYWLDRILRSYQSRIYSGDVGSSFEVSVI